MEEFVLNEGNNFIALNQLLKVLGWVENGAMANLVISSGMVTRNNEKELRKRAKIIKGDTICFNNNSVIVRV